MIIDPLETVLQYLKQQSASLGISQIASQHHFGAGWKSDAAGLVVRLDGGPPDIYLPLHNVRLEMRFYGGSQAAALTLALGLVELSRQITRELVNTTSGPALLHCLLIDSGMSSLYDEQMIW